MRVLFTSLFIFNLFFGLFSASAQTQKARILLVPYEYKMYFSEIDEELHENNKVSFAEINSKFRSALDQNLFMSLKKTYDPISFYAFDTKDEALRELSYIHSSIGYKYEVLEEEESNETEEKSPVKKLWNKLQEPKEKEARQPKEAVTGGQVTTARDTREKYMMTKLTNENLISTLNKSYNAQLYLFINQLDIKRALGSEYYSVADNSYKRMIKVHYTIFSNTGKVVSTGAKKVYFSANVNDLDKIAKQYIAEAAALIVAEIQQESTEEAPSNPVVLH